MVESAIDFFYCY